MAVHLSGCGAVGYEKYLSVRSDLGTPYRSGGFMVHHRNGAGDILRIEHPCGNVSLLVPSTISRPLFMVTGYCPVLIPVFPVFPISWFFRQRLTADGTTFYIVFDNLSCETDLDETSVILTSEKLPAPLIASTVKKATNEGHTSLGVGSYFGEWDEHYEITFDTKVELKSFTILVNGLSAGGKRLDLPPVRFRRSIDWVEVAD